MSDESGTDEVFLKLGKGKIWPTDEKYIQMSGSEQPINVDMGEIEEGKLLEIELWDYDTWSPNDKLGVFKMIVDGRGGPFMSDLIKEDGSGAKYSLEWESY